MANNPVKILVRSLALLLLLLLVLAVVVISSRSRSEKSMFEVHVRRGCLQAMQAKAAGINTYSQDSLTHSLDYKYTVSVVSFFCCVVFLCILRLTVSLSLSRRSPHDPSRILSPALFAYQTADCKLLDLDWPFCGEKSSASFLQSFPFLLEITCF